MHPFRDFVNPHLAKLLAQIDMDKVFVRGEDCYLYDSQGRRYLDLVAAYGALPFGYNPPDIWKAIQAVRESGEPSFIQPSYLEAAGELARRLIDLAPPGLNYVTFTNSGAEAAEAGIKLCRAASGRRRILATKNSFHGKTLGALSATGKESYQKAFGAPVEGFDFIPYGDAAAVEELFVRQGEEYAAFIIEPIQGEGGIVVPPPGYLAKIRGLCNSYSVLLILDEIQTGMGRTGSLFACEEEGVAPDVMLLAKALGGGIMPIGAVLCSEQAYSEEFAIKHSSTFAGNTLACRVGLSSLDLLTRDAGKLLESVKANGEILRQGLTLVQNRYPDVLGPVRGRGLMLGLDFIITRDTFPGSLIGVMAEQELLTPAVSSYLLNAEGLRVAPTLNGSSVIRIEPPLIISKAQCRDALAGLTRAVEVMAEGNTAYLLRHLVVKERPGAPATGSRTELPLLEPEKSASQTSVSRRVRPVPSQDPTEGRFAFLVHPLNLKNYTEFDESLSIFTEPELEDLTTRVNDLIEPFVISEVRLLSKAGATAFGEFIAVPRTADELLGGNRKDIRAILKDAVALARDRGARVVGLGAYTSVASHGGRDLLQEGTAITTGNSYTVVSAVEAVMSSLDRLGMDPSRVTVSVVGATGSIGRATAILLAEDVHRLVLIGNPRQPEKSRRRLLSVAAGICKHLVEELRSGRTFQPGTIGDKLAPLIEFSGDDVGDDTYLELASKLEETGKTIVLTTETDRYLPQSDVIVTATSSLATLVTPNNVRFGAVVLDLSRPSNVSREVQEVRPDVLVIDGGVVALPGLPSLGWNFGFEQGLAYACMAETMMLGLEHCYKHTSIGADLDLERILFTRSLAEKHGFCLAALRSFDRPLTKEKWEMVVAARKAGQSSLMRA